MTVSYCSHLHCNNCVTPTRRKAEKQNSTTMTNFISKQIPFFKVYWAEQKSKLKKQFGILTYADLHFEEGKKDEMLNRVKIKLGKTNEEFATIIACL